MMPSRTDSRRNRTQALTLSALMAAIALMFTYVEFIIPFSVGIPGVKLGLANLVILVTLYRLGIKYAMSINIVRILLAGLLFTSPFAMLYSLCGGILSLITMWGLKNTRLFSMIGVSMAGGVMHNLGQLIVAALVVENMRMFIYFPVLIFSGIASGIGIGIIAYILDLRIPKGIFPG